MKDQTTLPVVNESVYRAHLTDLTTDAAAPQKARRHGQGEPICPRCGDDNWVHLMSVVEKRDLGFEADDDECINCYDCSARDAEHD